MSDESDDDDSMTDTPITNDDLCVAELNIWHYMRGEDNEFYIGWSAFNPMTGDELRVTESLGLLEAAKHHMFLRYSGLLGADNDEDDEE